MIDFFQKIKRKIKKRLPLSNYIVFESKPELACNSYPVFKYMIDHGWNKKYKLIWLVADSTKYHDLKIHHVRFIDFVPKSRVMAFKKNMIKYTARCFISCNSVQPKYKDSQLAVFLCHGSKIKKTRGRYEVGDKVDYVLYQADFFKEVTSYEYNVSIDKLVCLGYPRNDYLYGKKDVVSKILPQHAGEKVIVWLPTWRHNRKNKGSRAATSDIPILSSPDAMVRLNDVLKENDIFMILKAHPAQDPRLVPMGCLSNFIVIDDEALAFHNIHLYELLAQSDALITDYSSVFFDYLLTDKPIGLTVDDLETYSEEHGFAYDVSAVHEAGYSIPTHQALCEFITYVATGYDPLKKKREEIRNLTNYYQDGRSTERVVEFIQNKLAERRRQSV